MTANRALVEGFLAGRPYPASRDELVAYARREGAGEDVVAALERLPDAEYAGANDVGAALAPVDPERSEPRPDPSPESGAVPGHEAYLEPGAAQGEPQSGLSGKEG